MYNGVINIFKEQGFTSHDVVAKLRGILKQKKIGHTGTLDPYAEGVLPVCLGNATKICDLLTDKDKTYETVMLLGTHTDTQDITGTILDEKEVLVNADDVTKAIMSFVGEYNQIPPMYSALKVNGKKLYELAREGIEIERKSRKVIINSIEIKNIDLEHNEVTMVVSCSKGTYIRTLCSDIGDVLGCGACMKKLLRTQVSDFTIDNSFKLHEIERLVKECNIDNHIIKVDDIFKDYPRIDIKKEASVLLKNGNKLGISMVDISDCNSNTINNLEDYRYRVYDENGRFTAVYEYNNTYKELKPVKMFLE